MEKCNLYGGIWTFEFQKAWNVLTSCPAIIFSRRTQHHVVNMLYVWGGALKMHCLLSLSWRWRHKAFYSCVRGLSFNTGWIQCKFSCVPSVTFTTDKSNFLNVENTIPPPTYSFCTVSPWIFIIIQSFKKVEHYHIDTLTSEVYLFILSGWTETRKIKRIVTRDFRRQFVLILLH